MRLVEQHAFEVRVRGTVCCVENADEVGALEQELGKGKVGVKFTGEKEPSHLSGSGIVYHRQRQRRDHESSSRSQNCVLLSISRIRQFIVPSSLLFKSCRARALLGMMDRTPGHGLAETTSSNGTLE